MQTDLPYFQPKHTQNRPSNARPHRHQSTAEALRQRLRPRSPHQQGPPASPPGQAARPSREHAACPSGLRETQIAAPSRLPRAFQAQTGRCRQLVPAQAAPKSCPPGPGTHIPAGQAAGRPAPPRPAPPARPAAGRRHGGHGPRAGP